MARKAQAKGLITEIKIEIVKINGNGGKLLFHNSEISILASWN